MFADASALTAILVGEVDARELLERLQSHPDRITSPVAVWETTAAVSRILSFEVWESHRAVDDFLTLMRISVVEIPAEAAVLALDAFTRFGKGRHPAALNMGDCFAYACARIHRVPLLYKGDDFALTDIERA